MECEAAQKELARDVVAPELRASLNAHVASCVRCRRAAGIHASMNEALIAEPLWRPPAGFALRMGALGAPVASISNIASRFRHVTAIAAAFILVTVYLLLNGNLLPALGGYLSLITAAGRVFLDHAVALMVVSTAAFVSLTAWLTHRTLTRG